MHCQEILKELEIRLITSNFEDFPTTSNLSLDPVVQFLVDRISESDYNSILQQPLHYYELSTRSCNAILSLNDPEIDIFNFFEHQNVGNPSKLSKESTLFFIGISSLQEFVRCNFCGPKHDMPEKYTLLSGIFPESWITNDIFQRLSMDGEIVYPHVQHPELLYLGQCLLKALKNLEFPSLKWWLLRATFLHQYILPERNYTLHSKLVSLSTEISQSNWLLQEKNESLKLLFFTEVSNVDLFYGEIKLAKGFIAEAQAITGLEIELSGAMGKRTQHQQKPVPQLYVKLCRNHSSFTGFVPNENKHSPVDLQLQDDTLLNKIHFLDQNEQELDNLYAEEQIVLLSYCLLALKSGSHDELLQEEIMSYVNCLLAQPQVWPVYVKALLMRCKAEKNRPRKVERAVMQLEAVVESIKSECPLLKERLRLFYSTSFPAYWMIEKELADLLLFIGCVKSALDIYERLELWEDIVECNIRLGRTSHAEKLIKEQILKAETPYLWCLLGDVTENPDHYLKAWELSGHRSARAQRSLGYYYFRKKEYQMCIPPFQECLRINNLYPQVWFSIGHAATQVENFELAAKAYRQVVMFDDDNFEAWNNLANAYIKTKQKVRAWRSLNEALKCNYEEWRVWENLLLVSTDVGAFEDAMKAWHRLFDLKGKHNDSLLIEILVNAIINDLPDINGMPASRLRKKALELLGRMTSVITNDPILWELYSALSHSSSDADSKKENLEKVILYLQKALRCHNQNGQLERDFNARKETLLCAEKLARYSHEYLSLLEGTFQNQQKASAKLSLQAVVARCSKNLSDFPDDEKNELEGVLNSLKNELNKILNI